MADRVAGINVQGQNLPEIVALIRRADQAGVPSEAALLVRSVSPLPSAFIV